MSVKRKNKIKCERFVNNYKSVTNFTNHFIDIDTGLLYANKGCKMRRFSGASTCKFNTNLHENISFFTTTTNCGDATYALSNANPLATALMSVFFRKIYAEFDRHSFCRM